MRRRAFVRFVGVTAVPLAGCSGGPGSEKTVEMTDDFRFTPGSVTVATGGTVTWENAGSVGHTVTAYGERIPDDAAYFASGGFDSEDAARDSVDGGIVEGGGTYVHTFEVTGEYDYFCVPHEGSGMTGTVRVRS